MLQLGRPQIEDVCPYGHGKLNVEANLRAAVMARARALDLPVQPGDIQITRPEGKLQLETKYAVQMDFPLYQVDLHFHANGASR